MPYGATSTYKNVHTGYTKRAQRARHRPNVGNVSFMMANKRPQVMAKVHNLTQDNIQPTVTHTRYDNQSPIRSPTSTFQFFNPYTQNNPPQRNLN